MVKMYVLADPETLKIRYIGITKEKYLSKRLGGHKYASVKRDGRTHHFNWLKKVYRSGKKPIIRKIAQFESWEEAREVELKLIKKYKISHNLTNSDDEGKFTPRGNKSARVYLTKPIYMYDVNGNFLREFPSSISVAEELDITRFTVIKILNRKGRAKNGMTHKFQLSREKVEQMLPLLNTSNPYQSQFKPPM